MATNLDALILEAERKEAALKLERLGIKPPDAPKPRPLMDKIDSLVSGDDRKSEDLPSLIDMQEGLSTGEKLRMAGAFATNKTELGIAQTFQEIRPDSKIDADEHGNVIVEHNGQRFFVNPPGMDKTDVGQVLANIAAATPAARFGSKGASAFTRFGRTAAAEGATSIGLDITARTLGSKENVNLPAAVESALLGGTVEAALRPVVAAVKGILKKPIFFRNGQLTERGRAAAVNAGLNPDDLTDSMQRSFSKLLARGEPDFVAGSKALEEEFGIKLTRGQKTGSRRHKEVEEAIRQGSHGEEPAKTISRFDEAQRKQLAGARDAIPGSSTIDNPVKVGGVISDRVQSLHRTLQQEIDDAYEVAGERGAQFTGSNITALLKGTRAAVSKRGIGVKSTPGTVEAMKELKRLSRAVRSSSRARDKGVMRVVDLAKFDRSRRRIRALIENTPRSNATDKGALIAIKSELDKFVDDAVDNALFQGDDQALDLLKKARGLRTELGKKFSPRNAHDEAGRIMQKLIASDPTTEQATNLILGTQKIAKSVTPKVVSRLKNILGPDSDEMGSLKEAVLLRMVPEVKDVRGAQKAINTAFRNHPTLMESLFSKDEVKSLKNLKALLARVDSPEEISKGAFGFATLVGRMVGAKVGSIVSGGTLIGASAGSRVGTGVTSKLFGAGRAARRQVDRLPSPASPGVTAAIVGGEQALGEDPITQILDPSLGP
tara:strand:- start:170 stop:2323 length:2154 start_codon:yes stop_codon:yes gene_type:complete